MRFFIGQALLQLVDGACDPATLAVESPNMCVEPADVFILLGNEVAQIVHALGQTRDVLLELTDVGVFCRQFVGESLSEALVERENACGVTLDVRCEVCGVGVAGLIGKASSSRGGSSGRERGEEPPIVCERPLARTASERSPSR